MSYEIRIESAIAIINQHNEAIGENESAYHIDPEAFIKCVKASGGTNEDRLSALSWEDLLECMPNTPIKPRVLAKEIAVLFRSKENKEPNLISSKKADRMSPRELLEAFIPEDSDNSVGKRLKELSKNEKFIVYSNERVVDVETSFKILTEIRSGHPGRDLITVGDQVKKVYRVGELPENYADENPLYPGRPLRPDGTCDQLGRSWEGVPIAVRQLIRCVLDLRAINHEVAHDILDVALQNDAVAVLQRRYPVAALKFTELLNLGNLPKLKVVLGAKSSDNQLAAGKPVVWIRNSVNSYSCKQ